MSNSPPTTPGAAAVSSTAAAATATTTTTPTTTATASISTAPLSSYSSPANKDPATRPLRRGDLVRLSEDAKLKSKRYKDRDQALGRITQVHDNDHDDNEGGGDDADQHPPTLTFDVEWILEGGKYIGLNRDDLVWTSAEKEGFCDFSNIREKRKRPTDFMSEIIQQDDERQKKKKKQKRQKQQEQQRKLTSGNTTTTEATTAATTTTSSAASSNKKTKKKKQQQKQLPKSKKKQSSKKVDIHKKKKAAPTTKKKKTTTTGSKKVSSKSLFKTTTAAAAAAGGAAAANTTTAATANAADANAAMPFAMDMYERHRREFERCLIRLEDKIDCFRHFGSNDDDEVVPPEFDENYYINNNASPTTTTTVASAVAAPAAAAAAADGADTAVAAAAAAGGGASTDSGAAATATAPGGASTGSGTTATATAFPVATSADSSKDAATTCDDTTDDTKKRPSPSAAEEPSSSSSPVFPSHPPFNWKMIRRRMEHGRYILDRRRKEEEDRFELFGPYYATLGKKRPHRTYGKNNKNDSKKQQEARDIRVVHPKGVDWQLFQHDVFAMCDGALERRTPEDLEDDDGQRGTLSYTVRKIKEALQQNVDRAGSRHASEMAFADDRHKFAIAMAQSKNTEAAMQSWRTTPFPERKYERLNQDAVCAGLSPVDEKIASFELQTSLPDSFVGLSYRYDDTGQSEAWMKSVVDETGPQSRKGGSSKKKNNSNDEERKAALALSADVGVTRAQVSATMQSLLIAVQDKVMTEQSVLQQPELRSANWMMAEDDESAVSERAAEKTESVSPEIVEQPVWGIDCYTRRNILHCLEIELDPRTALVFVEKWLLPAINACPADLAQTISNAARLLEGLPFDESTMNEGSRSSSPIQDSTSEQNAEHANTTTWSQTLLGSALKKKIEAARPPWLKAAANQLRRARQALGPDFFRVHPKGHGSVVLSQNLPANRLVTFYRGELYPSWRWGEKMDAIEITQNRKDLKPALPDFYNMVLERPQRDPRGYGLLFVDASRKAGHGSSLSHSCAPTCEVRVAACDGELCLAMTTLRELEMGEELTFDYNAVTESLNEYHSAVCLCGYGRCRGSFLHFATADCYQQVLNRNSPVASRFASLIKGSMKQVMSQDDELVLKNHGFQTASFGAISVNRHETSADGKGQRLVDSLTVVPVWLRTYVADTLRYIEYERRALPIALICDHLSTSEIGAKSQTSVPTKVPKRVPSFLYFSMTESDFIMSLLKKEGFPESLIGLQLKHAMQKVASTYWNTLTDEKKQFWKDKAEADYKRKLKVWRAGDKKKQLSNKKQSKAKKAKKPKLDDILHSSKISFHDADAEGVAAMEQRIQQLCQSLSRVGRLLDRHREGSLEEDESFVSTVDEESLSKRVHSPLRVLSDEEFVGWAWSSENGVVSSLLRCASSAPCARPQLLGKLNEVRTKYSSLDQIGDLETKRIDADIPVGCRRELTKALLEFRSVIMQELKEMGKIFRQFRSQASQENSSQGENSKMGQSQTSDDEYAGGDGSDPGMGRESEAHAADASELRTKVEVEGSSGISLLTAVATSVQGPSTSCDPPKVTNVPAVKETFSVMTCPWLDHYAQRFTLHAAADLLLLYAHTTNFFVLQPYRQLQSTPVEVYARELGNVVPRSAIDVGLTEESDEPTTVAVGLTPVKEERSGNVVSEEPDSSADINDAAKGQDTELCAPDDIVAKVSVKYQGDFVLAQLLQWYNGGIGQKPGLPDILGPIQLPSMPGCWRSELLEKSRVKAERKTTYERKVRPRLVEWLQDPFQRGNPWPQEIRKAFVGKDEAEVERDTSQPFIPFGSPVIDFLVTGDESNISDVLNELDADDKISANKSTGGLLSSVDKGRPGQAVVNWVQCENPKCMKWRKIPWHVDADLLPEKFVCTDNQWNPRARSCDAPEDDWDEKDALVGADGKVEGSPVKKRDDEKLSVDDESSFRIGTRFDVLRLASGKFRKATVSKVDFSGSIKRIMFHFPKTSTDRDEWVEFGSTRICPLHSKVPKMQRRKAETSKPAAKEAGPVDATLHPKVIPKKKARKTKPSRPAAKEAEPADAILHSKLPKKKPRKAKPSVPASKETEPVDPTNEESFKIGARFDVLRQGKDRYFTAVVKEIDATGSVKRFLFHFPKTNSKFDEWVAFGSPRICAYNSRVPNTIKERKRKKKEKELSAEKQLSVVAASISKAVLTPSEQALADQAAASLRQDSKETRNDASSDHDSKSDEVVEDCSTSRMAIEMERERLFSKLSRGDADPVSSSMDCESTEHPLMAADERGMMNVDSHYGGQYQSTAGFGSKPAHVAPVRRPDFVTTRPPDFVTPSSHQSYSFSAPGHGFGGSSYSSSSAGTTSRRGGNLFSGLDVLAAAVTTAVSNKSAFGSGPVASVPSRPAVSFQQPYYVHSQAEPNTAEALASLQQQQRQPPPPPPPAPPSAFLARDHQQNHHQPHYPAQHGYRG